MMGVVTAAMLSGCYPLVVPVYTALMAPGADSGVVKRQELHDQLQERYEQRVAHIKETVTTYKRDIDAQLRAAQLGPALKTIKHLHAYTHVAQRKIIKHEGLDDEEEFIAQRLDVLMQVVKGQLALRRFDALEQSLVELDGLPARPEQLQALLKQRASVKVAWLDAVIKDAQRAERDAPGAAILYYAKADGLAQELKDPRAQGLAERAKRLRESLIKTHAFYIKTEAQGHEVESILKGVVSKVYTGQVRFDDPSASPTAALTLSVQPPSYAPSTSSGVASFTYQAGVKQIRNPKLDQIAKDIEHKRRSIKDEEDKIRGYEREIADKQRCQSGQSREWCDGRIQDRRRQISARQRELSAHQDAIAKLEAQRGKLPATLSEPVYAQQEYPTTSHHLTGTMPMMVTLRLKGAQAPPSLSARLNITHRETDLSHDAHRRQDAGVLADPVQLPTAPQVWPGLRATAQREIIVIVERGLLQHQAALHKEGQGDRAIHHLALFMLIGPYTQEHRVRLDALTGISDSAALLMR